VNSLSLTCLCVVIAGLAGYAAIVAPAERQVQSLLLQSRYLYERTNRNERVLAQRGPLLQLRERVRRDVVELGAENTPAKASLAFIELLDREGKRRSVNVSAFAPEDSPADGDRGEPIAVAIRGRYSAIVAFLADLTRHRPLLEVKNVELSRHAADDDVSEIDGRLSVILYHNSSTLTRSSPTEAHDSTDHD
jgi:hypothetical protein